MNFSIRNFFIWKTLILSVLISISTEILSFFDSINSLSIKILWVLLGVSFIFVLSYLSKKKNQTNLLKKIPDLSRFEIIFIFLIFCLTFINSLIYPPNTLDAMAYHLPKVMHWVQNGNLDFYPTHYPSQLILAPFAEFVILHLQLLFNGDYFFNLVQWYSMIISCLTISLIAKELGCKTKFQIISVLFCATLPMGILQATSTQNDYVASMWLSIMVYFLLRYINKGLTKYIFAFAFALGLGILTKGTFYIYAFAFCVWITLHTIIKNRKNFFYLFSIPLILLFLNFGHYNRNVILYDNPLGLSEDSVVWTNEVKNIKTLTANLVRNSGLNLAVPNVKINKFTAKKITLFLESLNISTKDSRTTRNANRGYYMPFSLYESSAPNTPHFIIIILLVLYIIYKKKLLYKEKYLFYSLVSGYMLFSFLIRANGVQNRLLLPFFVLSSPLVGFVLCKLELNKFTKIIAICLSIYSIPYLLFNKSRPLLANLDFNNKEKIFNKPFFLEDERNKLYFIADKFYNSRDTFDHYVEVTDLIKNSNCQQLGFDNQKNTYLEYPIWVMLRQNQNTTGSKILFSSVNVKNKSTSIKKEEQNCAVLVWNTGLEFVSVK